MKLVTVGYSQQLKTALSLNRLTRGCTHCRLSRPRDPSPQRCCASVAVVTLSWPNWSIDRVNDPRQKATHP